MFQKLVSFVYNLGCGNLSDTLLADVRAKKWVAAANQVSYLIIIIIFQKILKNTFYLT
jgi:GH24 family phage-related lysozyme (muramidase)